MGVLQFVVIVLIILDPNWERPMPKVDLDQLITECGLARVRAQMHKEFRPCALVRHIGKPTREALPPGVAKLGGAPDIRPGFNFVWPTQKSTGVPFPMVMQLPLADVHEATPAALPLPEKGYLYLFYGEEAQPPYKVGVPLAWYDPDATPSNVRATPTPDKLWLDDDPKLTCQFDLVGAWDSANTFPEVLVTKNLEREYFARTERCVPYAKDLVMTCGKATGKHTRRGTPWLDEDEGCWPHQIGGFPISPQETNFSRAGTFVCLINSDRKLGWTWGDMGRINYFSPKGACKTGDFSTLTGWCESG